MRIALTKFRGMVPKVDEANLSDDHASFCRDVKFYSERLEGFSAPKLLRHLPFPEGVLSETVTTSVSGRGVSPEAGIIWDGFGRMVFSSHQAVQTRAETNTSGAPARSEDDPYLPPLNPDGIRGTLVSNVPQLRIGIPQRYGVGFYRIQLNSAADRSDAIRFYFNAANRSSHEIFDEPSRWAFSVTFGVQRYTPPPVSGSQNILIENVREILFPISEATRIIDNTLGAPIRSYLYDSSWIENLVRDLNQAWAEVDPAPTDRFAWESTDEDAWRRYSIPIRIKLIDLNESPKDTISDVGGDLVVTRSGVASREPGELSTYFPIAPEIYMEPENYRWLRFQGDVDVVRGPVPSDEKFRTYYTKKGGGLLYPKMTYLDIAGAAPLGHPAGERPLGIPRPSKKPDVSIVSTDQGADDVDKETRVYAYSFVSNLGEEGPLSPPSDEVEVSLLNSVVNVTAHDDIPSVHGTRFDSADIPTMRFYRASTGGSGVTAYLYVGDLDLTDAWHVPSAAVRRFRDDKAPGELGGQAVSQTWFPPPPNLHSLQNMANGFLMGVAGNQIFVSETNLPHAWNYLLAETLPYEIIGLGAFGVTSVAFTREDAHLISGASPAALSATSLKINQGCLSKRGIVSVGYRGVIYPSPDGLYHIHAGGYENLTREFFERNQWNEIHPERLVGVHHERMYFGFYGHGQGDGFIFDPNTQDGSGLTHLTEAALFDQDAPTEENRRTLDGVYSDPLSDRLILFARTQRGIDVLQFDEDDERVVDYEWHSKLFDVGYRIRFRRARIHLFDGSVTLTIAAGPSPQEMTDVFSNVISDSDSIALPREVTGRFFKIKIHGTGAVRSVVIAENKMELRL